MIAQSSILFKLCKNEVLLPFDKMTTQNDPTFRNKVGTRH